MENQKMFEDKVVYDSVGRTLISVRDGFQEYLGIELNIQPYDKVFRVYRSPETIYKVHQRMNMIPVTDDHIQVTDFIKEDDKKGFVVDSNIKPLDDISTQTTLCIVNTVKLGDEISESINDGKIQLSLGYTAQLVPHSIFDFEQIDILPHHLAVVQLGRCGDACKFLDERIDMEVSIFKDEDGTINIAKVSEIVNKLPSIFSELDLEEVKKLIPVMQEAMAKVGVISEDVMEEPVVEPTIEEPVMDEIPTEEPMMDAEAPMPTEEVKAEEVPVEEPKDNFMDSQVFKDAVRNMANYRVATILKAKEFLDSDYKFEDKCTTQIMKDAIEKVNSDIKFEDSEIPTAFKMLKFEMKKVETYKSFGDSKVSKWQDLKTKEI